MGIYEKERQSKMGAPDSKAHNEPHTPPQTPTQKTKKKPQKTPPTPPQQPLPQTRRPEKERRRFLHQWPGTRRGKGKRTVNRTWRSMLCNRYRVRYMRNRMSRGSERGQEMQETLNESSVEGRTGKGKLRVETVLRTFRKGLSITREKREEFRE